MPTVLITGASRGIGFEFARHYAEQGWRVLAAVRSPESVGVVESIGGDIHVPHLDVADPASVAMLAERLRGVAIDIVINNAGQFGPRSPRLGAVPYQDWRAILETNVLGAMRITESFLEHLLAGERKTLVAVTGKMGSLSENRTGGQYIYRSSKAAMNAVFRSLAIDLASQGVRVALLHPGWVRTEMGGPRAPIDVHESVTGMCRVIDSLTPEQSGCWLDYAGCEVPW